MSVPLEKILHSQTKSWQSSEACTIQDLLERFSLTVSDLSSGDLLDLVCNEVFLRESVGQSPTLQEYQQQFPEIHDELETQWQINVLFDTQPQRTVDSQSRALPADFGRYEILREVGRGAMGIVYEAYDRQLRRIVALKCLRGEFGRGSVEFERFQNEAESIGQLSHANLVQVFDFGIYEDTPYIVMEFCSGGTLAERLSEPMVAMDSVDMLIAVASAVGAAHAAGIIHRDLKPANILLAESEGFSIHYKVSDFGLAKSLDLNTSATLTGSILGSPAYMPPEQAAGDHRSLGPTADVYALGAILFQCLTARPPFVGDSIADVLYQVQHHEPLLIRQLNPRTPRPLETIVAKCLSKVPSDRYATAADLRDDLIRFRSGAAILARPERVDQRLLRLARRHRMTTALISTSLLLLLGLVVSSLTYSVRLKKALTDSKQSAKQAMLEKAEALLGKSHGHRVSMQPGRRLIAQDILREAVQVGKDLQQPSSWFGPYRDEAIETMWLSDLCIRQWKRFSREISFADFSPSGKQVCVAYKDGGLDVMQWDTGKILATSQLAQPGYLVYLDEERFLSLKVDAVECYRQEGQAIRQEWTVQHQGDFMGGYWLDTQRHRLFVGLREHLLWIDWRSGVVIDQLPLGDFKGGIEIAIHPQDPIYLIAAYSTGAVEIRNLDTHEVLFQMKYPSEFPGASGAEWNPGGTQFLLANGDGVFIEVYEWDRAERTARLLKRIDPDTSLGLSSVNVGGGVRMQWTKNNWLLTHNWSNVWGLYDSEFTSEIIKTRGMSSFTNFSNLPHRFPEGSSRIALCGSLLQGPDEAGPLEIDLGDEQRRLVKASIAPVHHLAISSDGQFAVCYGQQKLHFINLAQGTLIGEIDLGITQLVSIALDGQNRLTIVTSDFAMCLQLQVDGSRILLSSAKRVSMPPANPALTTSVDGKTMIAGYWMGYFDMPYGGVWVKKPSEPTFRKILYGKSGKRAAIDESTMNLLFYGGSEVYRASVTDLKPVLLGPCALDHALQFHRSGAYAVAGGKLWDTASWQAVEPKNPEWTSAANGFSHDNSQAIYTSRELVTQFLPFMNGQDSSEPYLQMEGSVVHYDSQYGKLLRVHADGLYYRDLRRASLQLSELGLSWDGPEFKESPPLPLDKVVLSEELANLQGYSQWMDYLDDQALRDAQLNANNGHFAFHAAMVYVERCDYE